MKNEQNICKQNTSPCSVDIKSISISLAIHSFLRLLMTWANEKRRVLYIVVMCLQFFLYGTNEAFLSCWREKILILRSKIMAGICSCRSQASGRSFADFQQWILSVFWIKPSEYHNTLFGALIKIKLGGL